MLSCHSYIAASIIASIVASTVTSTVISAVARLVESAVAIKIVKLYHIYVLLVKQGSIQGLRSTASHSGYSAQRLRQLPIPSYIIILDTLSSIWL